MATHTVGKYTFRWTSQHMPRAESDALKYQYDELGSETVIRLQQISQAKKKSPNASSHGRADLYKLLEDRHTEDDVLSRFWDDTHHVPEWVDWEQIERGQKFLYRYALANLMGFALQGFMGENTAAPGISEVLVRTGGFSTRTLLRRLLETFQFLLQATQSIDAIKPGGVGHITTIRVRLLHSMVRERVMKLEETRGNYFDIGELGYPISTIGSIHSITTFSCNHSWLQLPQMGVHPSAEETGDYVALFRYIAHVIGTPTSHFETTSRARATMESMLVNEFRLNETSYIVAHNFIQCLTDLPPFNISKQFIEAGSRALNGHEFCDSISLGRPGLYPYACFKGFCWLVSAMAFAQHASSAIDAAVTNFFRRTLHDAIIRSEKGLGGGSRLDFTHVPQIGKSVGKKDHDRSPPTYSWLSRPVEAFLFAVFAAGCLAILMAGLATLAILQRSAVAFEQMERL